MIPIIIIMFTTIGFIGGYFVCHIGSWGRVHKQESNIRALANDISVMRSMGDTVPAEWVEDQLESMLAKDFR